MLTGIVFDIKKFSIHDGPGIRTTVFLKGCPLRCWWCHNPEGQTHGPELILRPERCIGCRACVEVCVPGAIAYDGHKVTTDRACCSRCGACAEVCYTEAREMVGREMTVAEVMDEIRRDAPFYDASEGGVTLSGGEPLSQPDFLRGLLAACHRSGLHTCLDTCGFGPWTVLDEIRGDVDLFLYDVKLVNEAHHREVTGVSNERILANLRGLSERGERTILRVPLIPGINDDEANVHAIGTLAVGLPALEAIELLPYHKIGRDKYERLGKRCPMPEVAPPRSERVEAVRDHLQSLGLHVILG